MKHQDRPLVSTRVTEPYLVFINLLGIHNVNKQSAMTNFVEDSEPRDANDDFTKMGVLTKLSISIVIIGYNLMTRYSIIVSGITIAHCILVLQIKPAEIKRGTYPMTFKKLFYCRNASTVCINSNFPLRKPEMAVSTLFESVCNESSVFFSIILNGKEVSISLEAITLSLLRTPLKPWENRERMSESLSFVPLVVLLAT